jgi:hypothetical protein
MPHPGSVPTEMKSTAKRIFCAGRRITRVLSEWLRPR